MEAGRSAVSCSTQLLPRTNLRNCSSSSTSSVLLFHEQVVPALASLSTTSLARNSPTSVLTRDQGSQKSISWEEESLFQRLEVTSKAGSSSSDETKCLDSISPVNDFHLQLLQQPGFWFLWPSLLQKKVQCVKNEKAVVLEAAENALSLAREALSASLEAMTIIKDAKVLGTHSHDLSCSRDLANFTAKRTVRSTRLLERQGKKRRTPRLKVDFQDTNHSRKPDIPKKMGEAINLDDPFRLFLNGPEKTKLLTADEESELIIKIQEYMKIQEKKNNLQSQLSREPTVAELASAVGISCQDLQLQTQSWKISREKLIYANFRMVVHIARQYQGRGLSIQDLLQEGSLGLMKSVEKFKPHSGCRFATYAYWWIRQAIRKALFQHSRTIRLPENVYGLLSRVYEARNACSRQGNVKPSTEELASHCGIPVGRLQTLLQVSRAPLSLQKAVYTDCETTYQEITADMAIETPDAAVAKLLMRRHARNLLSFLNPREKQIIRLRFGMDDGKQRSLLEIGEQLGLTKERIRQLEARALYKLKQSLNSQGLAAYAKLLM